MTKKKVREVVQAKPADFGDFLVVNHDKLSRVIDGSVGREGKIEGGLGKNASAEAILAEYDKLGGLILTKDGAKVATGSFWDFEKGVARPTPLVTFKEASAEGLNIREEKTDGSEVGPGKLKVGGRKKGKQNPNAPKGDKADAEGNTG